MQTCLTHQGKKPHSLEGNGLTTCVRTGYDEKIKGISKCQTDRNNFFTVQKRVSSLTDPDPAFGVKDWAAGVHIQCQCTFCKNKIQFYKCFVVQTDFFNIFSCIHTEAGKDHLDFFLLLGI